MPGDGATTLGDRLDPNRPKWEDLRDSSAEDLLESQEHPGPPLHSNSYIETPEPSFDLEDGGVSCRLQHATDLHGQPVLANTNANLAPVPEAGPQFGLPGGTHPLMAYPNGNAALPVETTAIKSPLSAGAPEFIPMLHQASLVALQTEHLQEQHAEEQADDEGAAVAADAAAPGAAVSGPSNKRIRGKRPRLTQTAERTPVNSRPKRRRNEEEESEDIGGGAAPAAAPADAGGEMPPATEEEWQRRIAKRQAVVGNVKETQEYQAVLASRARSAEEGSAAPTTPDPTDRRISKRNWETRVMQWRTGVRQWASPAEPN